MKAKSLVPWLNVFLLAGLFGLQLAGQQAAPGATPANLTLPAASSALSAETLLDPEAEAWQRFPAQRLSLNRTPKLYDTELPAEAAIPAVEVRAARASGRLLLRLSWRDPSHDAAEVAQAPEAPPVERFRKEPTAATGRFFDAAAVMFPPESARGGLTPSLQMGDAKHPVTIYYWNAARGPMQMKARGRSTTERTGESFPARGVYRAGRWRLTLALPELPPGVPLAFAVWNGEQHDRDGRKYFTVWHWLE